MAQVIDLRKPRPFDKDRGGNPGQGSFRPVTENGRYGQNWTEPYEWRALEYEAREHGPYWFIGTGAVATALIILGIFAKSYFFIAFVALAYITLVLYAKRPPKILKFSMSKDGISAGRKFYGYKELKSFWILDTSEGKMLSLETEKTLSPYLHLPLGKADPQEIRERLHGKLPEKEHQEFITDHITRGLGL